MSTSLIETYYQHFNAGDFSKMVDLVAEDVVHELNEGPVQKGQAQFREFMAVMDKHYSEQVKELVVFSSSQPGRFAAEFFIDGKYTQTQAPLPEANNQPYYIRVGAFFEVKNNKISRITNHYNLNQWIQAVR